jgi:predicted nucleic acid-binding protein
LRPFGRKSEGSGRTAQTLFVKIVIGSFVLDASVVCKWYFREAASEGADRFRGSLSHAPDLIYPEVANVVWKRFRKGDLTAEMASEVVKSFSEMPFLVTPSRDLLDLALMISSQCDRSVYDAIYVALAFAEGVPLITADQRLVNSLQGTMYAAYVQLLT